jgi:hypothetical protein
MARHRHRGRRCRNCPAEQSPVQQAANLATAKTTKRALDPSLLTLKSESARLWNHVLFGTGTCVGMIEGYISLGLPGDPLPQIHTLIHRLGAVAAQLEEQHADQNPKEHLPGDTTDR